MLKHILIPLDGSPLAETALAEALRLCDEQTAITLVSAVDLPEVPVYGFDMVPTNIPYYQQTTQDTLTVCRQYLEGIARRLENGARTVRFVVQLGEAADVITETATELHVDAIVMSTHGRTGLNRWLFGSVTGKVLASASCPVLVVPTVGKQPTPPAQTPEVNYG